MYQLHLQGLILDYLTDLVTEYIRSQQGFILLSNQLHISEQFLRRQKVFI
jgi:hypothetical protein